MIMKKLVMTLVAAVIAVSASAQVYLGGGIGFSSVKIKGADAETTFKFLPEVGYNIDESWAVGMVIGYSKGAPMAFNDGVTETFAVNPYVRYTALKTKYVNLFFDGTVGYASVKDEGSVYEFGIKPGLAVNLNEHFSFVTHVGFFGYNLIDPKADGVKNSSQFGLNLDGRNNTFGVYYNF